MKKQAAPIGDVLKQVFASFESKKEFTKEDAEAFWATAAGADAARHSRPAALRKGVLTVWVGNSTWMQELAMRKRQILKRLKSEAGKDKITEIHFKIGEF